MRIRGPRSLGGRAALAAAGASAVAFAAAGGGVLLAANDSEHRTLDRDLYSNVKRLEDAARDSAGPYGGMPSAPAFRPPGPRRYLQKYSLNPGVDRFARVLGPQAQVLREEGAMIPANFPEGSANGRCQTVTAGGDQWRTIRVALGPGGASLQVAASLEPLGDRARQLRNVVALAFVVAVASAAALALLLSRVALAPLARLRAGAARVRETGDLSARIDAGGGVAETDALAGELNGMLAQLQSSAQERERALTSAQRFAADAGHELRTPLTSLTASLATLHRADPESARAALDRADGDLRRLVGLVEQLQALARGDAGLSAAAEDVDLGELADGAIDSLRQRHPDVDVVLDAPAEGPLVRGDADGLRQIVDNLLENAALHGRRYGRIVVTLREGELLVDDDGPGVPEHEREAVLERFVRGADATATGTGLGLAIVVSQAQRHGGTVSLEDAPAGGLRVRVSLMP